MLLNVKALTHWLSKTAFASVILGVLFFAFAYFAQDAIFSALAVLFWIIASVDLMTRSFFQ